MSNPLSVSPRGEEGGRPPQSPCLGGRNVRLLSVSPRGDEGGRPPQSPCLGGRNARLLSVSPNLY